MRTGITIDLIATDRTRLEVIAADRNSPQRHVWRTRVVLLSAAGVGTNEIRREPGLAKTSVWRWQERFMKGKRHEHPTCFRANRCAMIRP